MIENISWSDYLHAISVSAIIYYLVILFCFYRNDFLGNIRKTYQKLNTSMRHGGNKEVYQTDSDTAMIVHQLIEAINAFAEKRLIKEEVITGLKTLIKQHGASAHENARQLINDVIISKCKEYCSIRLDEGDVKRMWMD